MKTTIAILLVLFVAACQIKTESNHSSEEPGRALAQQCISCHPKNSDFVHIRKIRSSEWIYSFVRNPAGFSLKNAEAKLLLEQWKPVVMGPFPNLTDKQIDLILDYYESK